MQNRFNIPMNTDAVKDVKHFREEIEKEKNSENPDYEKLQKLYMQELNRGMELGLNDFFKNNGYKPY